MSDPTEFWKIRNGLLQANFLDYQEALRTAPAAPSPTPAHRRWEKKFLSNPDALIKPKSRSPRLLRLVACLLIVVSLVFVAPAIIHAFFQKDTLPKTTPTGLVVTIQLEGRQSTAYTCEKFTCVSDNGSTLWFWYENLGASTFL